MTYITYTPTQTNTHPTPTHRPLSYPNEHLFKNDFSFQRNIVRQQPGVLRLLRELRRREAGSRRPQRPLQE